MAKRYILVDDLDNRESTDENPVETVYFGFRGKSYEIDLSSKNGATFDKVMSRYLEAAKESAPERPAPASRARGRRSAASTTTSTGSDAAEIRAWAQTKPDIKLSPRGRVPAPVRERYYREIGTPAPSPAPDGSQRQPEPATSAG